MAATSAAAERCQTAMCIKGTVTMLHLTCAVSCVQCISFIIICLVVYFLVVMPMNALMNKFFVSPIPPGSLRAVLLVLRWSA